MSRGFTLIELLITITIVAILATVAFPMAEIAVQRSREHELRSALREIRGAIDAYYLAATEGRITRAAQSSGYPETLEILAAGVPDAKNPNGAKIYFLRRIPRDPFERDASMPAAATWGKRSYASPPDDPRPGDDVYDVYSMAAGAGVGLNGIAYREW